MYESHLPNQGREVSLPGGKRARRVAGIGALILSAGCGAATGAQDLTMAPPTETAQGTPRPPASAPQPEKGPVAPCAILAINDTYHIESLPTDKGGMPRVRALRKELEKSYPDLLVVHAGDIISPSFLGRMYKGSQMIDAMNRLDGGDAFDARLFATFGNHEFDVKAPVLTERLEQAKFRFVSSNVHFAQNAEGKPEVAAAPDKLLPRVVVPCGPLKVGLFGLTIDSNKPAFIGTIDPPLEVARREVAALRKQGADAVVAITHLSMNTDKALLAELGAEGPDVSVGGHEHQHQSAEAGGHAVYKADADGVSAYLLHIEKGPSGVQVKAELKPLEGAAAPQDPEMRAWVDGKLKEHEERYCTEKLKLPAGSGCLGEPLAMAGVDLLAEELEIRRFETNLGDWIVDLALGAFPKAKQRPSVAFINSGTLRINTNLPKDKPVTRQNLEELFAYPADLKLVKITGETLQRVADRSVQNWTGEGHFLQIAGFAFKHDPATGKATDLTILGPKPRKVAPKDTIYAVTIDYLVMPSMGNQDGYGFLTPQQVVETGPDIKVVVLDALAALKKAGKPLAPQADGRICNLERKGPCLLK